jgi:hypothetical protein
MLQFLEAFNFPQDIAVFPGFVLALHLLDGNYFVVGIHGFEDDSKGAIAYRFEKFILLHV